MTANEFTFMRVYKGLSNSSVTDNEVRELVKDLASRTLAFPLSSEFKDGVDFLHKMAGGLSVDKGFFKRTYPEGDHTYFNRTMDEIITKSEVSDEEIFLDFSDTTDGELFTLDLQKGAPSGGMTTKAAIKGAINEYERLYQAGFSSPGEILTLSRFYPENDEYRKLAGEILEKSDPMIVGGPASVEMVDREGHLITMEAMNVAFQKFMSNIRTRNAMVLHSDVQVGWALPAYINKAGQIFKSGVNENHLYFITEMRDDTKIAKRVLEQVKQGRIRSYSIAGSAIGTEQVMHGKDIITKVTEIELAEVTLCEKGVNQGAHFNLLKAHGAEGGSCIDGSCLIGIEKEQAGPGSGVPHGTDSGGNYNPHYGGFDPDKDLPKAGDTVEIPIDASMDSAAQGTMSPALESTSEMRFNLEEVAKMFKGKGDNVAAEANETKGKADQLGRLQRFVQDKKQPATSVGNPEKGTLKEIWDTPAEIETTTKDIREKYGWPDEENSLEALREIKNNPPVHGTTQRGTAVTTAGEDDQTFPMEKAEEEDCGCDEGKDKYPNIR